MSRPNAETTSSNYPSVTNVAEDHHTSLNGDISKEASPIHDTPKKEPTTQSPGSTGKENTIHIQSSLTVHLPNISYGGGTFGPSTSTTGSSTGGGKERRSSMALVPTSSSMAFVPTSSKTISHTQSAGQTTVVLGQNANLCEILGGEYKLQ